MKCQRCNSLRVLNLSARAKDMHTYQMNGISAEGYAMILSSDGDTTNFDLCLDCGQIQGDWPHPYVPTIEHYGTLLAWAEGYGKTEDELLRTFLLMEEPWNQDPGDIVDAYMSGVVPYKKGFIEWWDEQTDEDREKLKGNLLTQPGWEDVLTSEIEDAINAYVDGVLTDHGVTAENTVGKPKQLRPFYNHDAAQVQQALFLHGIEVLTDKIMNIATKMKVTE